MIAFLFYFFLMFKRNLTKETTTDIDHTQWIVPTTAAIVSILILTGYCAMAWCLKKGRFGFSHFSLLGFFH